MKRLAAIMLPFIAVFTIVFFRSYKKTTVSYGAPPYIDNITGQPQRNDIDYSTWKRPNGPPRVGLQAGHWKTYEMPEEQKRLRENGGGTSNGQVAEWQVNLAIAQETKKLLEQHGIVVDILPATVPPGYWADAFVAIHADGSTDPSTTGFKVAAPRRDVTGKAAELTKIIEEEYGKVTGLPKDPNITRNMTGYYAFSWRRFEHAIHPMTTASILETGFLTNPTEAQMLVNNPELPSQALANALITYIKTIDTT